MTIGQKIKQLRLEHGLKQQELADKLSVNVSCISHWEHDDNEPHLYALIGMADIFGIALDELCCREIRGRKENDKT
jgi:transcriptional regulator with XRE-family HTH domain